MLGVAQCDKNSRLHQKTITFYAPFAGWEYSTSCACRCGVCGLGFLMNDNAGETETDFANAPRWMKIVLLLAGVYNLAWGAFVVFFPLLPFRWAGMEAPRYVEIWQCVGMIVGVYGVGYVVASAHPLRHWPIVLVGLLGKVFGPIGMANAILSGKLPVIAGWVCVFNDLIWWLPFALILWRAYSLEKLR
jgi:hypothetical protein